jgi:hypothetical protein
MKRYLNPITYLAIYFCNNSKALLAILSKTGIEPRHTLLWILKEV